MLVEIFFGLLYIRGGNFFVCLIFVGEWPPRKLISHENFYVYDTFTLYILYATAQYFTPTKTQYMYVGLHVTVQGKANPNIIHKHGGPKNGTNKMCN